MSEHQSGCTPKCLDIEGISQLYHLTLLFERGHLLSYLFSVSSMFAPSLLIWLVTTPTHMSMSTAPTYDDFGALLALEAETLLRHLDRAKPSPSAAAAGNHGVQLKLNRGQLGILHGRVGITIGVQRVIELLPIIRLNVAHNEVPNYSPDKCFQAYRHPCYHIASAKGSLRN
jgi:hypothetical protein